MTGKKIRRLGSVVAALAMAGTGTLVPAMTAGATTKAAPTPIGDAQMQPSYTTIGGGATVLPTTRTVAHWWGSTTNPTNGVTYGYNMVGADPNTCSGTACDATVQADITPINVVVDGQTFSGSDVVGPTLASPVFALNDYGSTANATDAAGGKGPGGALSQGDAGVPLQLEDATMRAQFDKTGAASPYHLRLQPTVEPAITIDVPANQGTLLGNSRGIVFADVNITWWSSRIQNLEQSANPTHLPIYLTNGVMNYEGHNPLNCCVIGFHGTRATGNGGGSTNSKGNAKVQTFAWASWVQPGTFSPTKAWALQDIQALSHEISEWADDPFVNNAVQPWLTPTAPQYGCSGYLETGDPVVGIGFTMGTNTYDQNQYADGSYHPEDEVFLPWYMRQNPNTTSEPTQSASAYGGRYTLMGDLNPYPGFRQPATGC